MVTLKCIASLHITLQLNMRCDKYLIMGSSVCIARKFNSVFSFLASSHELVDNVGKCLCCSHLAVERGLLELRKLGIEVQLWQASRKVIDPETTSKMLKDNDF